MLRCTHHQQTLDSRPAWRRNGGEGPFASAADGRMHGRNTYSSGKYYNIWNHSNEQQFASLLSPMAHFIAERGEANRFAVSVPHTCCCLREVVPRLIREGLVRGKQAHLLLYGSETGIYQVWLLRGVLRILRCYR